jgi:hypothetical protein
MSNVSAAANEIANAIVIQSCTCDRLQVYSEWQMANTITVALCLCIGNYKFNDANAMMLTQTQAQVQGGVRGTSSSIGGEQMLVPSDPSSMACLILWHIHVVLSCKRGQQHV